MDSVPGKKEIALDYLQQAARHTQWQNWYTALKLILKFGSYVAQHDLIIDDRYLLLVNQLILKANPHVNDHDKLGIVPIQLPRRNWTVRITSRLHGTVIGVVAVVFQVKQNKHYVPGLYCMQIDHQSGFARIYTKDNRHWYTDVRCTKVAKLSIIKKRAEKPK